MLGRATPVSLIPAFLAGFVVPVQSADWPQWRGPQHDGISPETGIVARWEAAPPQIWKNEIGAAFSAFSCVGDRVYTCGTQDNQQMLFCLNAGTGELIWRRVIEPEYKERQGGDGARATPTVADGRVYVQGATGRLLCCDAQTGDELWSHIFKNKPKWGYSASVLVEGDLAIAMGDAERGALVALERRSGKPVWKAGGDALVGYATPYPFTFAGTRYIVGFLGKKAIIVTAKDGREVCSIPWETDWDVNAATPIFHEAHLFLTSGYKTGSALFRLRRDGDVLHAEQVWGIDKVVLGKFQSPVLWEGHLYISDQDALKCIEFMTGKLKWRVRGIKDSTVLLADRHLIVLAEDGGLEIAPVSPEKYEPVTKVELLSGRCWTVPTLYQGRLYVRNLKLAACYQLTK